MFRELWLQSCGVCLDNDKELYFVNECKCTSLVCAACFKHIDKCPFCRKSYKSEITQSEYSTLFEQDMFVPLPGVFRSTLLSRQDANKAKENWNFYFYRFGGRDIMRPHLPQGLIYNHDIIHRMLRTGCFNHPNEAGICLNRREAYHFVRRQLDDFIRH